MIADEETPTQWKMAMQSPRMWRWIFAVWESPAHVSQGPPELQSSPSSQKFSPGGKFQASKAYVFTRKLLNRPIETGEHVNLDPLMPLPCQVLITRTDQNGAPIEYANITDLQAWPQGVQVLTADLRSNLGTWLQMKRADTVQHPPTPGPVAAPQSGSQAPPPPPLAPQVSPPAGSWATPAQPMTAAPQAVLDPTVLCQHQALPQDPRPPQSTGLCGNMAVAVLAGHRICALHKAQAEMHAAQMGPQPAPPAPSPPQSGWATPAMPVAQPTAQPQPAKTGW